jgi:hypothetical protein
MWDISCDRVNPDWMLVAAMSDVPNVQPFMWPGMVV